MNKIEKLEKDIKRLYKKLEKIKDYVRLYLDPIHLKDIEGIIGE